MSNSARKRDIETLSRVEGNLKFLITSFIEGRVGYRLAKAAIANEARFLERLIEIYFHDQIVLLEAVVPLKNSFVVDETEPFAVTEIIDGCTTLIAVSKIILKDLGEVRE